MCDTSPLKRWLYAIAGAIAAAVAAIVVAAVANGSFWYAWTSPIGMLTAGAVTYLAVYLCGRASDALEVLCRCTGDRCFGPCTNIRNVLTAAKAVLGIQGTACLAAAAQAWIPYVGQPVMWVIIGALTIQLALIVSAIVFMTRLSQCAAEPAPLPGPGDPIPS